MLLKFAFKSIYDGKQEIWLLKYKNVEEMLSSFKKKCNCNLFWYLKNSLFFIEIAKEGNISHLSYCLCGRVVDTHYADRDWSQQATLLLLYYGMAGHANDILCYANCTSPQKDSSGMQNFLTWWSNIIFYGSIRTQENSYLLLVGRPAGAIKGGYWCTNFVAWAIY